jgi:hypothetical protein
MRNFPLRDVQRCAPGKFWGITRTGDADLAKIEEHSVQGSQLGLEKKA